MVAQKYWEFLDSTTWILWRTTTFSFKSNEDNVELIAEIVAELILIVHPEINGFTRIHVVPGFAKMESAGCTRKFPGQVIKPGSEICATRPIRNTTAWIWRPCSSTVQDTSHRITIWYAPGAGMAGSRF